MSTVNAINTTSISATLRGIAGAAAWFPGCKAMEKGARSMMKDLKESGVTTAEMVKFRQAVQSWAMDDKTTFEEAELLQKFLGNIDAGLNRGHDIPDQMVMIQEYWDGIEAIPEEEDFSSEEILAIEAEADARRVSSGCRGTDCGPCTGGYCEQGGGAPCYRK